MIRAAMAGWETIGSLGGLAALIWAVGTTVDRLTRTVGGLVITYRAVFSADDRPIHRLQQVLPANSSLGDQGGHLTAAPPPVA